MIASRRLLAALGCVALASSAGAAGTSEGDCRAFHQECLDAKAVGYRDAGICNIERLECPFAPADAPRELETSDAAGRSAARRREAIRRSMTGVPTCRHDRFGIGIGAGPHAP
jgi:hypothetical protein